MSDSISSVPQYIKIYFIHFWAVLIVGGTLAQILAAHSMFGCPATGSIQTTLKDIGIFTFIVLILLWAWVIRQIFWPHVLSGIATPIAKLGGWYIPNTSASYTSTAFSTRPGYLLIDATVLITTYAFGWDSWRLGQTSPAIQGCNMVHSWGLGVGVFFAALFIPLMRLFAWYVLKRRFPEETLQENALRSLCITLGVVGFFVGGVFLAADISLWRDVKNAPIVDHSVLSGGITNHEELKNKIIRLRGTLKYAKPVACSCMDYADSTTTYYKPCGIYQYAALIDLKEGGDVLAVQGPAASMDPFVPAGATVGDPIELVGTLKELPDPKISVDITKHCGNEVFSAPPTEGRSYFELY